jgi:N-methylhydantoinase A
MKRFRVAVDIGGTFVDAISFDRESGAVRLEKASTTPSQPSLCVMEALTKLQIDLGDCDVFVHGTTLGINAILERKGAVTGIITNDGFRDIFEIGRADVPPSHMYDFGYQRPPALVQRRHRVGTLCRIDAKGSVVTELDRPALQSAAKQLVDAGVQAIAICFLHSYKNPKHETEAATFVRDNFPGVTVSASCEITKEYREYERTSTTVLDASIRPIFYRYIDQLESSLLERRFGGSFLVMRSSGGAMTASLAKESPIFTVLSGPAGGIIGATTIAHLLGKKRLLSLDYGGTSLDACVIEDGEPLVIHEATLEHFPVLIPIFDIRCIGAGGGSIAWVQEGLLQVGPKSAGAVPGPIAYGKGGTEPTTTDAALILGFLDPDTFLKGALRLDVEASRAGMETRVAKKLGNGIIEASAGVFDVLVARTVGAIREITVERGKDPREFSILAFGGAGPMIAPLLAREMGISEMIVPQAPAAFSAWGMLMSDLVTDFSQTDIRLLTSDNFDALEEVFIDLNAKGQESLTMQSVPAGSQELHRSLECRYLGQEHTLEIPLEPGDAMDDVRHRFDDLHQTRYGHSTSDAVQIVTLRVRAVGRMQKPAPPKLPPASSPVSSAQSGVRQAFCFGRRRMLEFNVYRRSRVAPGHEISGPAIIDEGTSTTVIHSDQRIAVDEYGNLIIHTEGH